MPSDPTSAQPDRLPYYRDDLALVHHLGFGAHADACAPAILELLAPVRANGGLVVELGCGSGALTGHLVRTGHRVIATDASRAMVELARQHVPGAEDVRQLALPDDSIPDADAIVSVGHVLNYLPNEASIERALVAAARALRPGGILALDLCDQEYGRQRRHAPPYVRVEDDWVIITRFTLSTSNRFVREITTFLQDDDQWRRDDERHENVLIDTSVVPVRLAEHGVQAAVAPSFGDERLPAGLMAVIGRRVE